MTEPIQILLFGAGNRGASVYGRYGLAHPDQIQFVAVAEPNPVRREQFASAHHIPVERQFKTWQEALADGKIADAVLNATQDEMHHDSALAAIQAGYDMLLEKPIAPSLEATLDIVQTAEASGKLLMICHVLRYTEFFQKVYQILNSGQLGQVVHIAQSENVSYYHMAHSYVRGNWRNATLSAPMILAKCCHDLDLLYWFLSEKAARLSSTGNLRHFVEANAPQGAPKRCTDGCPAAETCPFYAPRIYIQSLPIKAAVARSDRAVIRAIGKIALHRPNLARLLGKLAPPVQMLSEYSGWPRSTITEFPESDKAVYEALGEGPYGRCVYRCDNDVVDHQIVNLSFPSGITTSLTMHGHSHEESRTLRVDGSQATLLGKFAYSQAWLEIHPHFPGAELERFTFPTEVDQTSGHGGGDAGLMRRFVSAMRGEQAPLTNARDSLESHLMAFAAEESRLNGKTIDMNAYRQRVSS
jgi:predicted dehydrogenase